MPRYVAFNSGLLKSTFGKVLRRELRDAEVVARPVIDLGKLAENCVSLALHLPNHDPNPYTFIVYKAQQAEIRDDTRALPELDGVFTRLRDGLEAVDVFGFGDGTHTRALLADRADALIARSASGRSPNI